MPPTIGQVVGVNVRRTLEANGLTQADLAQKSSALGANIKIASVSYLTRGQRHDIGLGELLVLAYLLDASPAALLTSDGGVELVDGVTAPVAVFLSEDVPALEMAPGRRYAVENVAAAPPSDADARTAARRGLSSEEVRVLAVARWGRTLTEEREARLAAAVHPNASAFTRRSRRGHITRQLMTELLDTPTTEDTP